MYRYTKLHTVTATTSDIVMYQAYARKEHPFVLAASIIKCIVLSKPSAPTPSGTPILHQIVLFGNSSSFDNHFTFFPSSLACEKIQISTCLQLYHLAVAIVPPVVRAPQFKKGCHKVSEMPHMEGIQLFRADLEPTWPTQPPTNQTQT